MDTNRLWIFGTLVLVLIIIAGTMFLGVFPLLEAAAKSNTDRATVEAQNQLNQNTLDSLKEQYEDIESLRDDLAELREAVPLDMEETPFIDQVGDHAVANNVLIESFEFDVPVPYIPGATDDPDVSAAIPQVSAGNFYVATVRIDATGALEEVLNFVDDLQNGTRLFLVHEFAIAAVGEDVSEGFRVNIVGEVFVLAGEAGAPVDPGSEVARATLSR